jgi:hypothetical protein
MLIHGSLQRGTIVAAVCADSQSADVDPLVHRRQRRNIAGDDGCGLLERGFPMAAHDARLAAIVADFQPCGQVIDNIIFRRRVDSRFAAGQEVAEAQLREISGNASIVS